MITGLETSSFKWADLGQTFILKKSKRDVNLNSFWLPGTCEFGTFFYFTYKVYIYKNNQLFYTSPWLADYWQHAVEGLGPFDILRVDVVYETISTCMGNVSQHASVTFFDHWGPIYLAKENPNTVTPLEFLLDQNYPNPFNPSTKISFSLAVDSKVSLKVFDVLGQEVAVLLNGQLSAGSQEVNFNAGSLNSGVYFYRIDADGIDGQKYSSVKKMILTK